MWPANRAALLFHEAEDIVLEATRRRRQAQKPKGNQPAETGTQLQGQAPPPPLQTSNPEDSTTPGRSVALPGSADVGTSGHQHMKADLDGLAADLDGMHVTNEAQHGHNDDGVGSSEQDSEGYWSESQWDSSASYTGPEQTCDSDHQHDSSDAEHGPHAGDGTSYNLIKFVQQCMPN